MPPPGHHAFADQAGGFCFLNNAAIAAQYCRDRGARRVAILDVDVHHGNGTQGIFYRGYRDEIGSRNGDGFNYNYPLAFGTRDDEYLNAFSAALVEIRTYAPDVLIVALGLDASKDDPLTFLSITTNGFRRIGAAIASIRTPTLLVQEGGYISDSLGDNLVAALGGFENAR